MIEKRSKRKRMKFGAMRSKNIADLKILVYGTRGSGEKKFFLC